MCVRVTCSKCGKASWSGCGAHVEQVLAGVPQQKRCMCPRAEGPALPKWVVPVLIAVGALMALKSAVS